MPGYAIRLITVLAVTLILSACQTDSFYIENASLSELQDHRAAQRLIYRGTTPEGLKDYFQLTGHRVVPGMGTVLAYRAFSRGVIPLVDQAGFEKLTIVLPDNLTNTVENRIVISDGGEAIVFWSRGSSNFPRIGCYGYAVSGSITVTNKARDTLVADLDMILRSISPGGWEEECGTFAFKKALVLDRKTVQQLTPWEGTAGSHIYDESIRK